MEDSQKRASAIPRLSRLPRPASAIPKPTSALPRPASSTLRPAASRESLTGASSFAGGELRNPRLRPSASRDQLRGSVNGGAGEVRNPRLRAAPSREQMRTGPRRSSIAPSTTKAPATPKVPSTPQRSNDFDEQSTTPPFDPPGEAVGFDGDEHLFQRRLTLTRRPSEVFATSPPQEPGPNFDSYSIAEDEPAQDVFKPRSMKPRPSLSERTMETLAQIPSSPAIGKKSSTFFDQGRPRSRADSRPRSRAGSTASRPGSSYTSDGSGRLHSRAGSRPGSSAGQNDVGVSNFRASISSYKPPLTTINGTPQKKFGKAPAQASKPKMPGSAVKPASAGLGLSDAGRSSPSKIGTVPKPGSKTVAARPLKTRKSTNGLFKKPSLPALDKAANFSADSSSGSWDGTIPSVPSSASTNATSPDTAEPSTPSSARKSSAALRDQIAKAKAARRAQIQQATTTHTEIESETPIVPKDDGFDFGVNNEDPFNLQRGKDPKKKVLLQRVGAARTSGRLNIAALDLKEIPVEVMNMYNLESVGTFDGSWAESVDLTRLVAADNELEELDDAVFPDANPQSFDEAQATQGNIFAGLETLDLHGNLLKSVPLGLRRLNCLTSLNLSSNRLTNDCIDIIAQMSSLRDLKLASNLFYGPLNSQLSNLGELEILDVHGNNISALPQGVERMSRLRILNLGENSFESLSFDGLAKLPLTELVVKKNKLSGTLIEEPVERLPNLQTLDASSNQLTRIVPLGSGIEFPVAHSISLSMNRLQGLPDMTSWTSLLTLTVDENNISGIPNSFTSLEKLRHADFSSNDIRVVPPEVSRMENLSMIRLSGNPLRDKKFLSITTEDLKVVLAGRLEPPPPYQEPASQVGILDVLADAKGDANTNTEASAVPPPPPIPETDVRHSHRKDDSRSDDDFATPPQSPERSRSHTVSSRCSRSRTLSNQSWPVKSGGILDRSKTESSSLHPVVASQVASQHQIRQVFLQNNLFATFPNSLSFFAETMTSLCISHNQLLGETYLTEDLELPALKELNVSTNHITSLGPLVKFLHAPNLEKLDVSLNKLNALPTDLLEAFPTLRILAVANNQIAELEPDMIRGLKIVDVSNNDIAHLNPQIGLLGGPGGLEKFDAMGNRFRIPRWNVLERGTESTLRWLRGRVPVAEMAAWKGDNEPEVE